MHPARLLLSFAILALISLASAQEKKKPPVVVKTKEDRTRILKLFVSEFVELTPGKGKFPASFMMGSTGDSAPASEKPAVKVTFKRPFSIAKYEVTQELWVAVMGKNPSRWEGPRNSVEMITWDEAVSFCTKVTELLRKAKLIGDKDTIRLPSEAEWEYACRAGSKTNYSFGDAVKDLTDYAWYKGNSKGYDPPVGKKKGNAWGLYDMHGYVWEWCSDDWQPSHKGASSDGSPRRIRGGKEQVIRGGSWADLADSARSAFRNGKAREHKSDTIGFRCVRIKGDK